MTRLERRRRHESGQMLVLVAAGMVVLVLGVAFFLRYAFERAWLSPLVRVYVPLGSEKSRGGRRWFSEALRHAA